MPVAMADVEIIVLPVAFYSIRLIKEHAPFLETPQAKEDQEKTTLMFLSFFFLLLTFD